MHTENFLKLTKLLQQKVKNLQNSQKKVALQVKLVKVQYLLHLKKLFLLTITKQFSFTHQLKFILKRQLQVLNLQVL